MLKQLNQYITHLTDHGDLGRFVLRITIAGLMLFHGVAKLQHGVGWIEEMLVGHGLPSFIAYGVYVGEVLMPILVILGLFTRPAALVMFFNLIVATLMVGLPNIMTVTNVGAWGLETESLFALGSLAIALLGSGRYAIAPSPEYR